MFFHGNKAFKKTKREFSSKFKQSRSGSSVVVCLNCKKKYKYKKSKKMSYTTEGTIETIFDEETHGNNGFKKRVIWLKTEEQYSQTLEIQFTQYNVGLLDGFHNGDRVRVTLGVNGRKTEKDGKEKVFNSLNAFGISKL